MKNWFIYIILIISISACSKESEPDTETYEPTPLSLDIPEIFKNNIIPLLQEYFFGDYGKIGLVLGEGFVKSVQPKTNVFANLKNYDGAQDYNQATFELITIDEDFNISEAIQLLMPKKEVEA